MTQALQPLLSFPRSLEVMAKPRVYGFLLVLPNQGLSLDQGGSGQCVSMFPPTVSRDWDLELGVQGIRCLT
jgi:hypothetical protein